MSGTRAGRDVYTVSELNEKARSVIERAFGTIAVEGEISNLARPTSGHIYFSLKDTNAQLRCAMFRSRNTQVAFELRDGLHVLTQGRVSLYTARGEFQLVVESIEPAGEGLLRIKFERLKQKLHDEGLFDVAHKRELPSWPRAIGVVTSATGAALQDILTVTKRRCPIIPVILYPTPVQGEGASTNIAHAIETASRRQDCDVLIVGRGGGSLEDLWPFNEENVARAIHASTIPVVSAVGHEIDFTISDLVADQRAPTPSAAGELVSPDILSVGTHIIQIQQRLRTGIVSLLKNKTVALEQINKRLVSPGRRLELYFQRLDEFVQRLPVAFKTQLQLRRLRLQTQISRMNGISPQSRIKASWRDLRHVEQQVNSAMKLKLHEYRQTLTRLDSVLQAVGPNATLARGYAIVSTDAGKLITDVDQVEQGGEVTTRLGRGRFRSIVTSTEEK